MGRLSGSPAPAPTSGGVKPFAGDTTPINVPGPVEYPTSGFAGTPDQSASAAYIAGLPNGSQAKIDAQNAALANQGVVPGLGGSSPNPYQTDPGYQAALAQEQLGLSQGQAALKNLMAQRIIAYGDPALASMAGFGLDPQSGAFARQNYLSGNAELARIDRQHKQNLQHIINVLAGRGILFSGETGYQTGQEDTGYGNNVYDAQQRALQDILGYRQSELQSEQGLHQATIQALQNAYANFLNHPELGGYGAPSGAADSYPYASSSSLEQALRRFNTAQRRNRDLIP